MLRLIPKDVEIALAIEQPRPPLKQTVSEFASINAKAIKRPAHTTQITSPGIFGILDGFTHSLTPTQLPPRQGWSTAVPC